MQMSFVVNVYFKMYEYRKKVYTRLLQIMSDSLVTEYEKKTKQMNLILHEYERQKTQFR